jgi:starch synthase
MLMATRRAIEDHGAPILVTCQETKSFTAAAEVARAFGVPLISTVHSTERRRRLTANLNPSQQAQHDLRMTMVRNSDAVIAVSHALRDDLVAEAPDVTDRVRVIHSTVSPVFADCRSTAARSSGSDGVLTIGYVGRLAVEKGVDRLPGILAALHELQPDLDVRLVIAGQGHLSAQLHMDLQALPSNVHYELLGSVPPSTMPQVYTACDLLLAPSRSDSFPLAILEAMSLGVPVIASDVGGIPESVQSGVSGLLVGKTAGPEEWAMHIVKCLSPEARDDLAASASLAFETRFSPELFASRLVDLYEEVSA